MNYNFTSEILDFESKDPSTFTNLFLLIESLKKQPNISGEEIYGVAKFLRTVFIFDDDFSTFEKESDISFYQELLNVSRSKDLSQIPNFDDIDWSYLYDSINIHTRSYDEVNTKWLGVINDFHTLCNYHNDYSLLGMTGIIKFLKPILIADENFIKLFASFDSCIEDKCNEHLENLSKAISNNPIHL